MEDRYKNVTSYYDKDAEETRFDIAFKQIERINTEYVISKYVSPNATKVLDCAAGAGVYVDFLLGLGGRVVASDLSPKHVEILRKQYGERIDVYADNATDLSRHADNTFDTVLCCGPLYHLGYDDSVKCIRECLRVCKDGGQVIVAYMNKHFVGFDLMFSDYYKTSVEEGLNIANKGVCEGKNGFWGCARFISPEECESMVEKAGGEIIQHSTVDSDIPFFFSKMREFDIDTVSKLAEYVRAVGDRRTMLGSGKHNLIIIRKRK